MRFPRTLSLLPLAVFSLLLTPQAHADFQDGKDAYDRSDYETALKEWRPLAEQGNAEAQFRMGRLYDYVQQSEIVLALYSLGEFYANGQGVPQDYVQAHMWYNLAAGQNVERAAKAREDLAKSMTSEQIAEAERLAREWLAQHQK
jgi:TPR repeat protein